MINTIFEIISDNIHYFRNNLGIALVNIKKQNKSSDLGWVWTVLKPMMYIAMFYIAISLGFKSSKSIDGIVCPYFIWLTTGLIPWFYVRDMISAGAKSFKVYKNVIKKVNYPSSVIPMIPAITHILIHIILVGILIVMSLFSGVRPSIHWIQLPLFMALMIWFVYVWSLFAGLITVITADFSNLIQAVKPALFWLSGIFFNTRGSDEHHLFFMLNPITYLVEGYRSCFCFNSWFWENPTSLGFFLLVMLVLTVLALFLYRKLKITLPEIV